MSRSFRLPFLLAVVVLAACPAVGECQIDVPPVIFTGPSAYDSDGNCVPIINLQFMSKSTITPITVGNHFRNDLWPDLDAFPARVAVFYTEEDQTTAWRLAGEVSSFFRQDFWILNEATLDGCPRRGRLRYGMCSIYIYYRNCLGVDSDRAKESGGLATRDAGKCEANPMRAVVQYPWLSLLTSAQHEPAPPSTMGLFQFGTMMLLTTAPTYDLDLHKPSLWPAGSSVQVSPHFTWCGNPAGVSLRCQPWEGTGFSVRYSVRTTPMRHRGFVESGPYCID